MSIQKKNGKYYAVVYSGYRAGKRHYEWSQPFTNKKLAKLEESKMQELILNTGTVPRIKSDFPELASSWLKTREKIVAHSTFKMNEEYYNTYIKNYFQKYNAKEITPLIVNNFLLTLDYSPATITKIMGILSMIMEFAKQMDIVYINPCSGIKKPKVSRPKHNTWSEDQISEFLSNDIVKKDTAYIPLVILFTTGMRPGEVCGLRWCDYHNDHFNPSQGISRDGVPTDLKNAKAHDTVYIPNFLISELKRRLLLQKEFCLSHGITFTNQMFINYLEPDLRPMTPKLVALNFRRLIKKVGMPKITLYEARHSFGTNMMKNDVNPKKVAELMRHTTVKTTLDNYSHVDDEMKKKEINNYNIRIM